MGARGFLEEGSNSAWKVREGFLEAVMAVEAPRRVSPEREVAGKHVPDGGIERAERKRVSRWG